MRPGHACACVSSILAFWHCVGAWLSFRLFLNLWSHFNVCACYFACVYVRVLHSVLIEGRNLLSPDMCSAVKQRPLMASLRRVFFGYQLCVSRAKNILFWKLDTKPCLSLRPVVTVVNLDYMHCLNCTLLRVLHFLFTIIWGKLLSQLSYFGGLCRLPIPQKEWIFNILIAFQNIIIKII